MTETEKLILINQKTILYALRNMNYATSKIISSTCQDRMDDIDRYFQKNNEPRP